MKKMTKSNFVKNKNVCSLKNTGRKFLQISYPVKDSYPKYLKTFKTQQQENKQCN